MTNVVWLLGEAYLFLERINFSTTQNIQDTLQLMTNYTLRPTNPWPTTLNAPPTLLDIRQSTTPTFWHMILYSPPTLTGIRQLTARPFSITHNTSRASTLGLPRLHLSLRPNNKLVQIRLFGYDGHHWSRPQTTPDQIHSEIFAVLEYIHKPFVPSTNWRYIIHIFLN